MTAPPLDGAVAHARDEQPWPPARRAWTAVSIIALSLVFLQVDKGVVGFLVEPMKRDFGAIDAEMSLLLGLAPVLFYAFVGLPMGRLADRYPRNIVLAAGVFGIGLFTMFCGLAQSFRQLFFFRMFTGTAETVHGPTSYSMMADYFPPAKLPRAIGAIQFGAMAGIALAQVVGGALVTLALAWPAMQLAGIGTLHGWQYVFLLAGLPGLLVALMIRLVPEPPRRGLVAGGARALPFAAMWAEVRQRRRIYLPMFLALALTSLDFGGILPWRAAFWQREYGWSPARIGAWNGASTLAFSTIGVLYGAWLAERLSRRHPNGLLRAQMLNYACGCPFMVASPLMPTAELSILSAGVAALFSSAGAIPQISALQIVTPNAMRGQISAVWLFMFTVV